MKVNLEVGNTADNLNNCEEFAVTAWGMRDHFTTLMKRYKSKTRREVIVTDLGVKKLSENEHLKEFTERLEKSERRTGADTQKRQSYQKWKKESSRNKKKTMERKMKVTPGIKTKLRV